MDLYFRPLACSLASRIAFYEAGADASYIYVDRANRSDRGEDYLALNPLGQVPLLRLDDGTLLTENSAILRYLADTFSRAARPQDHAPLQRWIGFINSELHTGAFTAILDPNAPDPVRDYALAKARARFAHLDKHLAQNEYLSDDYSVADGYLMTILNWTQVRGPDLSAFPHLSAYRARLALRDSVKRPLGEEMALYQAEQKRRAA